MNRYALWVVALAVTVFVLPGDRGVQAATDGTVTVGSCTVCCGGEGGSGAQIGCCRPNKVYSCAGEFASEQPCETPGLLCGEEEGCTEGIADASGCAPQPDSCPPSDDDGADDGQRLGVDCASRKTPFAGEPEPGGCDTNDQRGFDTLGADPILVSSRSAVTAPFTDFEVSRVSKLSLSRTHNSADQDLQRMGTGGIFANGWHHDWESYLTCKGSICSIMRGSLSAHRFYLWETHLSPDGSESWEVYVPYSIFLPVTRQHHRLVKRPSGEWIAFLSDGRTLRFQPVCTSCDGSDAYCQDVETGGRARLVGVTDRAGNTITVSYDPAAKVLLRLTDNLGHALDVRGATACSRYASELRYDDVVVARYAMSGNMLASVTDTDGRPLQSYSYVDIGLYWPRMRAVVNESGAAIAEFSYDQRGAADGLVDAETSLAVSYQGAGCSDGGMPYLMQCWSGATFTEYFRGPSGDTSAAKEREVVFMTKLGAPRRALFGAARECAGCAIQRTGSGVPTYYSCSGCEGPSMVLWGADGRATKSIDSQGHRVMRAVDRFGRETYRAEYLGEPLRNVWPIPSWDGDPLLTELPEDSREEWREYGVTRTIADGVTLELDLVTKLRWRSALQPGQFTEETYDYSQAPSAIDPGGYACTPGALPAGAVLCRKIRSGYVTLGGSPAFERHATFYSYDSRGRLLRTYGPINLDRPGAADVAPVEERVYWPDGASAERQGRLAEVKRYSSPGAQPLVTTYDHDLFGVSKVTAPDGTSATISKDGRGRPTVVTYADAGGTVQARTEARYYDGMTPRLRILPDGSAIRYGYDTKGRLASVEHFSGDPESSGGSVSAGWSEHYVYDQAGNRIHTERRDVAGTVMWQQDRAYDSKHRVVWESNPSQPWTGKSWSFTSSGFLTGTVDEEGRAITFKPDGLNRVTSVTRSGVDVRGSPVAASVASYQRNAQRDEIAGVIDGAGRAISYQYDDFGRLERLSSPTIEAGGVRWFRYDARDNLVGRGDANVTATYAYDGLDRLISVAATNAVDGSSISYSYGYDASPFAGRLTSITEPERTTHFTYDWAGRLTSEFTQENGVGVPLTTGYSYDASGRLSQLTYPSGLVIEYVRDPATGEVIGVREGGGGTVHATGVRHYPAGPLAGLTFGNGRVMVQGYNLRYEPVSIENGPVSLSYAPTPGGDVGAIWDRSEDPSGCVRDVTRSFRYDFLDRLGAWKDERGETQGACVAETIGSQAAVFTYVPGTDRVARQQTGGANPVNRFAFGYDLEGNLSAIGQYDALGSSIAQAICLRHDALGRMVLMGYGAAGMTPGGTACTTDGAVTTALARYKYDSRNRRVARQVNGTWMYVVSDGSGNPLSEFVLTEDTTAPWAKVRDYVWLDGRPLVQIEYGATGTAHPYYVHTDHLGAPQALTNGNGQLVWATFQRPYAELGEKTVTDPLSGETVVTNLRLPGQYDERLFQAAGIDMQGPYYNWNRWYLPGVGRYLEADPLALRGAFNGDWGPDWYGYAGGNPLGYTDPEGLEAYGSCWMKCIEKHRWDYPSALPFSAYPKWMLGFRTPVSSQPLTTIPSGIQFWLSKWGVYSGNALRTFGRRVSPIGTGLTIGEGFWDIGVIGTCAASCGMDDDREPKTCH